MRVGGLDITDPKVGSTNIAEVRVGSTLIWERVAPGGAVELFNFANDGTTSNTVNIAITSFTAGRTGVIITTGANVTHNITSISPGDWTKVIDPRVFRQNEIWYSTNIPGGTTTITCVKDGSSGWQTSFMEISAGAAPNGTTGEFHNSSNTTDHFSAPVAGIDIPTDGAVITGLRFNSGMGNGSAIDPITGITWTRTSSEPSTSNLNAHHFGACSAAVTGTRCTYSSLINRQTIGTSAVFTIGGT